MRYSDVDAFNISCWNGSQIKIHKIAVHEEETPCRLKQCVLNNRDKQTVEDECNGQSSCLLNYNFTSTCLREFRYINMSYTCKHENFTSISNFERDNGDWTRVSSNSVIIWERTNVVDDHTGISEAKGFSISATSFRGATGKTNIDTDNAFIKPICVSLWYQFYSQIVEYDYSLRIIKIFNGIPTSIFTAESNSTSFKQWNNISVDVYGKDPFKISLEADFKNRDTNTTRSILVDDISIAYRPCQGKNIDTLCEDINTTVTIECETQFLEGDIPLTFQQENLPIYKTNCRGISYVESELNTFCRTLNKSDHCKFRVLYFMNQHVDCIVFSKNISVTYLCTNFPEGSLESPVSYDMIGVATGVSGGVILTIIAVVIYRIKRSKPGKQEASSNKGNKGFDELQYDEQKPNVAQSSSQNKVKPHNSNLNIPEQLAQDGQESADLYNISNEDGTYDDSSNDRQRGNPNDNNIYSHTADNIYDSGSHHKLPDRNEETYDHFFGQQTEDEYDTTTRT